MTRRRTRGIATLGLMLLLVALVAPTASVSAAKPRHAPVAVTQRVVKPLRIEAGLAATAKAHGSVRVIVNFRQGPSVLAAATSGSQRALKRFVRTTSVEVAGIARATGGAVVRRYSLPPAMAIDATTQTLAALRASPVVASVAADGRLRASLSDSVPLVQADRAAAAGWGGTNQIVAVLDTGVQQDHPFLTGKSVGEACFASGDPGNPLPVGVGDCPNGLPTQTGAGAGAPCPWTGCYHGTHV